MWNNVDNKYYWLWIELWFSFSLLHMRAREYTHTHTRTHARTHACTYRVHKDSTAESGCMIQWWRGLFRGGCDCRGVGVIIVIIDRFCTALFPAREADSLRSCRMWFSMNDYSFMSIIYLLFVLFLNIYGRCTDSAGWLSHGWCHVEPLASRRGKLCVHSHTTIHHITLHSKPRR